MPGALHAGAAEGAWENLYTEIKGLYAAEEHVAALEKANQALGIAKKYFGQKHPKVGTTLRLIAQIQTQLGDTAAADTANREAQIIERESLNPYFSTMVERIESEREHEETLD
jgi:hypothetical protein